jgi:transposase
MMPFKSRQFQLKDEEKKELIFLSRSTKMEHRIVQRTAIILMLSEGCSYSKIIDKIGTNGTAISKWKRRFLKNRIDGLKDKQRRGKDPIYTEYDKARVIQLACSKPVGGYSRWSQKRIGEKLGLSQSTVSRILQASKLKPHKTEYWCGKSTDPEFESKMVDIIGLYMNPPENALVLSIDEKTQIQALDRTQPELPMKQGKPRRLTNTYKRNGTVSLIASLAVHQGEITAKTIDRNNSDNFLKFLKKIDRKYRNKHLHIIVDNLKIHDAKEIKEWLSHKRKITIHHTPTYSSWLNMIEIWFGILTKDVLKDAVWKSKKQLIGQLMEYIKTYNKERAKPFNWTYIPKSYYKVNNESLH